MEKREGKGREREMREERRKMGLKNNQFFNSGSFFS